MSPTRASPARRPRATAARRTRSSGRSRSAPTCSPSSPARTTRSARSHGDVELGLFCRKSLVEAPRRRRDLHRSSKQGLDFYADFFDYPYPFGKYDQVFVPEFNAGAMENVGCVTHNEYMVFRDPPTDNQRRGRAETILHEMAHMWFGDLVTMRWWNDLWLNESFATYMSYLCLDEATRFKDGLAGLQRQHQELGLPPGPARHDPPHRRPGGGHRQTFLNFDGITYGKGASVLKQLVAGHRPRRLPRRHARTTSATTPTATPRWPSSSRSLETGSGARPASSGRELWLETPSLNTIGSQLGGRRRADHELHAHPDRADDYPTIRPHQLEVGLAARRRRPARRHGRAGSIRRRRRPTSRSARAARAVARLPELQRPRVRQGRARPRRRSSSLEDEHRAHRRRAAAPAAVDVALEHGARPAAEVDGIPRARPRESCRWRPSPELVDSDPRPRRRGRSRRYVPEDRREAKFHLSFLAYWIGAQSAPVGRPEDHLGARADRRTPSSLTTSSASLGSPTATRVIAGLTIDQDMRWAIAAKFMAHGIAGRGRARRGRRSRAIRRTAASGRSCAAETSVPDAAVKADGVGALQRRRLSARSTSPAPR